MTITPAARTYDVRRTTAATQPLEPCREKPTTPIFLRPLPSITDVLARKPMDRVDAQRQLQERAPTVNEVPGETKPRTTKPVNADELQRLSPGLPRDQAEKMAPVVSAAIEHAGITDKRERAAFLAQVAHETDGFRTMEEYASGKDYEGRKSLGNTEPGDGEKFKGRGLVQLTGRENYTRAGEALGIDLVNQPELAAHSPHAERIAAWYWADKGIGPLAREGRFESVTRGINGGDNGKTSRREYYERALTLPA